MLKLSVRQETALNKIFSERNLEEAKDLITLEAGNSIPFCEYYSSKDMDRIRFALIKLSEGKISKLVEAIELANTDWRDMLMTAGFGEEPKEHNNWYRKEIRNKAWWQFW